MGHKADNTFFTKKRPWSERKDRILKYYLKPYLAKVAHLNRPILIVDGFAGPGKFGDGTAGSPLLIADIVQERIEQCPGIQLRCIESDASLYEELKRNLEPFPFAQCLHGDFGDHLDEIEKDAHTHTTFLYLDPYSVEGLEWTGLDRVFQHVAASSSSVEILLNFNAFFFARRGRAALSYDQPMLDQSSGDDETSDAMQLSNPSAEALDVVVGGDWWRDVLGEHLDFYAEVARITSGLCERLRLTFKEVWEHSIRAHWKHTVPKYSLVFGSRSVDALKLMNDAVVKSREHWAQETMPREELLFESRPEELVPDMQGLAPLILEESGARMARGDLIATVIRRAFGKFSETQIRQQVTELIKQGQLKSQSGKARIKDSVGVWRVPGSRHSS